VVDKYFTGAVSRIQGIGLEEMAKEALVKHFFAFSKKDIPVDRLPFGGYINGTARVSIIYSILLPFTCCSIQQG
jgi:glutamate synthase domain-containing protein 2